jgi:hypothetical protein
VLKDLEDQKQGFVEEFEVAKLCLEDIAMFDLEGMEKELQVIESFIERTTVDSD